MSWLVNPDVVSRRLGDTVVLVNLADNAIYELNRTGARTMELDAKTHRLYTVTAEFKQPAPQGRRPELVPGTFELLELTQ